MTSAGVTELFKNGGIIAVGITSVLSLWQSIKNGRKQETVKEIQDKMQKQMVSIEVKVDGKLDALFQAIARQNMAEGQLKGTSDEQIRVAALTGPLQPITTEPPTVVNTSDTETSQSGDVAPVV